MPGPCGTAASARPWTPAYQLIPRCSPPGSRHSGRVLPRPRPLCARPRRDRGLGAAVDAVLSADPALLATGVPDSARILLDELTVWGDATAARGGPGPRAPAGGGG